MYVLGIQEIYRNIYSLTELCSHRLTYGKASILGLPRINNIYVIKTMMNISVLGLSH
jgi:hypothetical protein